MGLKKGSLCHYCNEKADTQDHIVARCHLQKTSIIPMFKHQENMVPCCARCNLFKSWYRSDCNCEICLRSWENLAEYILPKTKSQIPVIAMVGAFAYRMIDRKLVNITKDDGWFVPPEEGTG